MEYHNRAKAKKPKADPKSISSSRTPAGQSGDRKRKREGGENGDRERKREGGENGTASASDRGARTATASASDRGARTAIINAKVAIECSSRQPGVKAENRAGCRELLLRDDATAKTTMPPSLRQPISLGSALSATASRRRTA